jgi:predicted phosphodiesterase
MTFAFDLISDLHVETWDSFDWTAQATAPYCVVAGDVCRDRTLLIDTLTHLGKSYPGGVFYIDGNDEHRYYFDDLGKSYQELDQAIKKIPNVVYLQDNVVIINGVAILGTNAWWTYDFDPALDREQSVQFVQDHYKITNFAAGSIAGVAHHDAAYLINSVRKLQTHKEVKSIVLVTHTVPEPWIVSHDVDLADTWRFNSIGNSYISQALEQDTEHKIQTWCFGHYHRPVDQLHNGIQWISNPRGRGDTNWCQQVYYPRRIEIKT